jgi:glycosyltransferase involved in cell wall biosynthesis
MKPLFSIITASYNSEKTIERTIESILKQSFSNFEYIIIDGKSTDSTVEIIKSFESRFQEKGISYKWISEKDSGIYEAFNRGVKLASGEWISFLGSDDYYVDNALELYSKEIEKLSELVDLVHSNVEIKGSKIINGKWSWNIFRRKMNIAHVGAFHHQNYFKKYGSFNTTYKIAGDYELLLRSKDKLKTHWFNEVTSIMSDGGISNLQIAEVYKETTRAKIETKSLCKLQAKADYYWWLIKYKIKRILNALTR